MELTLLKARLKLYKELLKIYQSVQFKKDKGFCRNGFCNVLLQRFYIDVYPHGEFKIKLPELWKMRPKKRMFPSDSWWTRGNCKPRIYALTKAIKLTEELILKQK